MYEPLLSCVIVMFPLVVLSVSVTALPCGMLNAVPVQVAVVDPLDT